MTRLLVDPATDFDDPGPVTLSATLLDPAPTLVRTFEGVTAATVVDLPAPDAASAWRLTARRAGRIVTERTVHWTGTDPLAWAALTDVDPTTLKQPAGSPLLDVSLDDLRTRLLGGASAAYDTLKELEDALKGDDTALGGILTTLGTKLDQAAVDARISTRADPAGAAAAVTLAGLGGITPAQVAATYPAKARTTLATRLREAAASARVRNSIDLGPITAGGPTVTTSTTNDAALTTRHGVFTEGAAASYRFRGGAQSYPAGWFGSYARIGVVTLVGNGNVDNHRNNNGSAVDFYTDAPKFAFWVTSGTSPGFMLEVDGQATAATPTAVASNGFVLVDFAGVRKPRRIRFESTGGDLGLGGVQTTAVDSVWAPPAGLRLAVVGDSLTAQTGATPPNGGFAHILGKLLGFADSWAVGIGGTGFTVAAGENAIGSTQRVADVVTANPDVLLIPSSQNDVGALAATITAAGLAAYRAYRAALPNVPIIAGGVHPAGSGPSASLFAVEDAMRAAFDQWADPYSFWIPFSRATDTSAGKPWIYGTGRTGATVGNGNADVYEGGVSGSDTGHPNTAGHLYLGRRWEHAIRNTVLPVI